MQLDSSILSVLRTFEAASRCLSFTKAATVLNLTQSAVSQQLRGLEERLGYPLFVRQARGVSLTSNGEALYRTTAAALSDIQRTIDCLSGLDLPLQLSCLPSLALNWLIPRLTDFHRAQQDVSVRLKAEFQNLSGDLTQWAGIDVAIRYDMAAYPRVHSRELCDEYLIAVASPEYLTEHADFVSGKSRGGVTLLHDVAPWDGAPEFIEWHAWMLVNRSSWSSDLDGVNFNLASLAIGAALNGQGVAMGRLALVMDDLRSGRLVSVPGQLVKSPARYVLATRHSEDARSVRFADWLQSEFARYRRERLSSFGV